MQIYGKAFWEARVDLSKLDCFYYKQANTKFSQHMDETPTVGYVYSVTENN